MRQPTESKASVGTEKGFVGENALAKIDKKEVAPYREGRDKLSILALPFPRWILHT